MTQVQAAVRRIEALLDSYTRAGGNLDPELIYAHNDNELRVSDLRLLLATLGSGVPMSEGHAPVVCRCIEIEGGMDRTVCRADEHRDYCENRACCAERGHEGDCDETAAL
jgi:hypothetical protein